MKPSEHWDALADDAERGAAYETSRGLYAGVYLNKAALYRKTAAHLRLEETTGQQHCACHGKPITKWTPVCIHE